LYACPGCDKAYKSINSLRRHVKYMCGRREPPLTGYTHLENSFICNKCDKIYKSKSSMRRHLVYECGKMPNIECPIMGCPYKSKLRDRMSQHVKMYDCGDNVVMYKCPIKACKYITKRRYDLKRHNRAKHKNKSSAQ
ncbi:unnamed protein product, partial [Tenebrio molitor]